MEYELAFPFTPALPQSCSVICPWQFYCDPMPSRDLMDTSRGCLESAASGLRLALGWAHSLLSQLGSGFSVLADELIHWETGLSSSFRQGLWLDFTSRKSLPYID